MPAQSAAMLPSDGVLVYDLTMRLIQIEESLAPHSAELTDATDVWHPLHHCWLAGERLQAILDVIRLPASAFFWSAPEQERKFMWRYTVYPSVISRETLAAAVAQAPCHPVSEADHCTAVLMDALQAAEREMQLTQAGVMHTTSLEVSRAALRGAWAIAAATRSRMATQERTTAANHESETDSDSEVSQPERPRG